MRQYISSVCNTPAQNYRCWVLLPYYKCRQQKIGDTEMGSEKTYKAELVGVFGYPVAENPTIVMQEAAFNAKGLNFRYLTIEVRPEDLEAAVKGLRAFNMKGVNLTIPHNIWMQQPRMQN
jgi:hypothetical protein